MGGRGMNFADHARIRRWNAAERRLDEMINATTRTIQNNERSTFDVQLSVDTAVLLIDACEHLALEMERTGTEQSTMLRVAHQSRRVANHYNAIAAQLRAVAVNLNANLPPVR